MAQGATSKPTKVRVRFQGDVGNPLSVDWKIKTSWAVEQISEDAPISRPVLKIKVTLPPGLSTPEIRGDYLKVSTDKSLNIQFSILSSQASADFIFTDKPKIHMTVDAMAEKPYAFRLNSCKNLGVDLTESIGKAEFLYAAIDCKESNDGIDVGLSYSADAVFESASLDQKNVVPFKDKNLVKLRLYKDNAAHVYFRSKRNKEKAEFRLHYHGAAKAIAKNESTTQITPTTEINDPNIMLGLGYAANSYHQPFFRDYTQGALLLKAKYEGNAYKKIITTHVDTEFNPAVFSSNQTGVETKYFRADVGVGFTPPVRTGSFRFTLVTGWGFKTMSVNGADFGYIAAKGPQAYPLIKKKLSQSDSLYTLFRVMALTERFNFRVLPMPSLELNSETGWSHWLTKGSAIVTTFGWSKMWMNVFGFKIRSENFSFSIGYGW